MHFLHKGRLALVSWASNSAHQVPFTNTGRMTTLSTAVACRAATSCFTLLNPKSRERWKRQQHLMDIGWWSRRLAEYSNWQWRRRRLRQSSQHNTVPPKCGSGGSKKFQLQPFRSPLSLSPSDRYSGYPCCPCYQSILSQFLEKQSSECSTCIFPVSPKAVDAICALTVTSSHLRWYVCSCFVFVCVRDSVCACVSQPCSTWYTSYVHTYIQTFTVDDFRCIEYIVM